MSQAWVPVWSKWSQHPLLRQLLLQVLLLHLSFRPCRRSWCPTLVSGKACTCWPGRLGVRWSLCEVERVLRGSVCISGCVRLRLRMCVRVQVRVHVCVYTLKKKKSKRYHERRKGEGRCLTDQQHKDCFSCLLTDKRT